MVNFKRCMFVLMLGISSAVFGMLPPEHEAERLLIQAEQYLLEGESARAESLLAKVAELNTALPLRYYFFRGQTLADLDAPKATEMLTHYVVAGGNQAPHYREALELITRLEQGDKERRQPSRNDALPITADPAPVDELKQLYLTNDTVDALLQHINGLLSVHAFTGSRFIREGEKQGMRFNVSVADNVILVRRSVYDAGQVEMKIERLEVMGIDPFVRYGCDSREFACWLYHPAQTQLRWLWVENNDRAAQDLSDSLRRLIVLLQRS